MKKQKETRPILPRAEWPYEVPENWVWTRWGICGNFTAGTGFPKEYQGKFCAPIPFYKVGSLKYSDNNGYLYDIADTITESLRIQLKASLIPPNSIIFAKIGEAIRLNRRSLNKIPCCIDNNMIAYTSSELCNLRYAYFWSTGIDLYDYTNATTVPAIRKSDLEKIPFPLPPRPEQQRIVARIELLFSKLDAAAKKIRAALDQFPIRKAAILHKAFTGELTKKWREEHGVVIESWKDLTLDDIAEYKKGPFGSSITKSMFVPKGTNTYKVYEQGNVIRKATDYGHYYISEEKYNELKGFNVAPNDILISCAGTVGEIFILPSDCEKGVINQALMRVRIFDNVDQMFFVYHFNGILKTDVELKSKGTAIRNIPPFKVLKAMPITLPTLPEQKEIVRNLDAVFEREQKAKEAAEHLLENIDLTKKAILARAFRGKLGTNAPKEASAEGLLLSEGKEKIA